MNDSNTSEDINGVCLDEEKVELALEYLETVMEYGETHLSHDEVRPSGHIMATKSKEAYTELVEAHPDYELES